MEGKFVQVPFAKYSSLQQLLCDRLPASAMLLNILQLQVTQRVSERGMKFYITGEDFDQDEAPLVIAHCVFEHTRDSIILFSLPMPSLTHCDKLLNVLNSLVNWRDINLFGDIPEESVPKLLEFYHNQPGSGHQVLVKEHCRFYWMDIPEGLQVKSMAHEVAKSSAIKIQPLCTEEAEIVDRHWGESREGTLQVITESIAKIGSFGVYAGKASASTSGCQGHDLVSWVVTSPLGSINALYTREDHRQKGYGEMALREVVRHNAQIGLRPVAHVVLSNTKSQQLMEKVGFIFHQNTYWLLLGGIQNK